MRENFYRVFSNSPQNLLSSVCYSRACASVSFLHKIILFRTDRAIHNSLFRRKYIFFIECASECFGYPIKYNMQFVLITSTNKSIKFELCTGESVINLCNTYQTIQQTRHTIARRNFIKSWLRVPAIIQSNDTLISWVSGAKKKSQVNINLISTRSESEINYAFLSR